MTVKPTDIKPPFTLETALAKVQAAENAWNTRDPERVALAYTEDSEWRNRSEFLNGREEIKAFLYRKWAKELDYKLKKELGLFGKIESPLNLPTNGTTQTEIGFAVTATSFGNSTKTA